MSESVTKRGGRWVLGGWLDFVNHLSNVLFPFAFCLLFHWKTSSVNIFVLLLVFLSVRATIPLNTYPPIEME